MLFDINRENSRWVFGLVCFFLFLGWLVPTVTCILLTLLGFYVAVRVHKMPAVQRLKRPTPVFRVDQGFHKIPFAERAQQPFDVFIVGAGFAGLTQARHLLLNRPGLRIGLADPLPEERNDDHLKIGESMVEVSSAFIGKELGLYDYMIGHHGVKFGLNYHWAKDKNKTDHTDDDYMSIWNNRNLGLLSFQINRAKLESDLLKMAKEMGVHYVKAKCSSFDLPPGDAMKSLTLVLEDGSKVDVQTKHFIDAAGRAFLTGRKMGNLLKGPEHVMGIRSSATWFRIRNFDRLTMTRGYAPDVSTGAYLYGTNHYMGPGHWIWVIPIDTDSISVGVVHHREVIDPAVLNTDKKLLAFFYENHRTLYNLIKSAEIVDFGYRNDLAYTSKQFITKDNWYSIGDAAVFFSPFYSAGLTIIASQVECVTPIILAKLDGENPEEVEKKRVMYEKYVQGYCKVFNSLYYAHERQLGHASLMSWRLYWEFLAYSSFVLPAYLGKWFMSHDFFLPNATANQKLFGDVLQPTIVHLIDELIERKVNLGMLDAYRADQLISEPPLEIAEPMVSRSQYERFRVNVFTPIRKGLHNLSLFYVTLVVKGFGWKEMLQLKHIKIPALLCGISILVSLDEIAHMIKNWNVPNNYEHLETYENYKKVFKYDGQLRPWWEPKTLEAIEADACASHQSKDPQYS